MSKQRWQSAISSLSLSSWPVQPVDVLADLLFVIHMVNVESDFPEPVIPVLLERVSPRPGSLPLQW